MRPLSVLVVLTLTLAAAADPVAEVEPNGFSTPDPQALGVLGAEGLEVAGALDPTSESGADPGDRDGYSFTMEAAGPLTAVVDDAGAGKTFVLALAREDAGGLVQIASSQGPAPLTLSCPGLEAGPVYRVGVAAYSDGAALPYGLVLSAASSLPAWTGQPCPGFVPEVEPNGDGTRALHLGDFVTVLCAEGVQSLVSPPGSGEPADPDFFMFRNVLPTPVRFVIEADPGTLKATIHWLGFVGPFPWIEKQFGGYTEILTPALQPGMTYLVQVQAEQGTAPIAYRIHFEPSAPPPPPPPEPADLTRGRLRLGPGPAFRLIGSFEPGLGGHIEAGAPVQFVVRGLEGEIAAGVLRQTRRGKLRYRAPRGTMGLRALDFDPIRGRFSLRGAGIDLQGEVEPGDPLLSVLIDFGDLSVLAEEPGDFSPDGLVLRVRR